MSQDFSINDILELEYKVSGMEPDSKKTKLTNAPEEVVRCKFYIPMRKRVCKMSAVPDKKYCTEHLYKIYAGEVQDVKAQDIPDEILVRCQFHIRRQKRGCRRNAVEGKPFCPEHLNPDERPEGHQKVNCPRDPTHQVYLKNLPRHLKLCSTCPKPYLIAGINSGSDSEALMQSEMKLLNPKVKLSEIDHDTVNNLIEKLQNLYDNFVKDKIEEVVLKPNDIPDESNGDHGNDSLRHAIQTASILGHLEYLKFAKDGTTFIEFGAEKGQISYFLHEVFEMNKHKNSQVLLVDKTSSPRYPQDKTRVTRIRADVCDFCLNKFDMKDTKQIVGFCKQVCGGTTDSVLRCLLQTSIPVVGFIVALCCHHRCDWKSFTGKKFLIDNGFNQNDFVLMTKITNWAICDTRYSRERRQEDDESDEVLNNVDQIDVEPAVEDDDKVDKEDFGNVNKKSEKNDDIGLKIVNKVNFNADEVDLKNVCGDSFYQQESTDKLNLSLDRRIQIGKICKRILDYARVSFMEDNNFLCALKYYVMRNNTFESVSIVGWNRAMLEEAKQNKL